MKTPELRAEARISVRTRGSLNAGADWFPCLIQEMSGKGLLLVCSRELSVGQVLDFRCELFPDKRIDCKIEVRHLTDGGAGAKIIEIDQRGADLCQLFLEQQYSDRLNRSR